MQWCYKHVLNCLREVRRMMRRTSSPPSPQMKQYSSSGSPTPGQAAFAGAAAALGSVFKRFCGFVSRFFGCAGPEVWAAAPCPGRRKGSEWR